MKKTQTQRFTTFMDQNYVTKYCFCSIFYYFLWNCLKKSFSVLLVKKTRIFFPFQMENTSLLSELSTKWNMEVPYLPVCVTQPLISLTIPSPIFMNCTISSMTSSNTIWPSFTTQRKDRVRAWFHKNLKLRFSSDLWIFPQIFIFKQLDWSKFELRMDLRKGSVWDVLWNLTQMFSYLPLKEWKNIA